jgi:hypothetical protein
MKPFLLFISIFGPASALALLAGSAVLHHGSGTRTVAKEPITATGCVMATSTCGLILKSQSGLFYELQGADLPQAASGTQVLVTGRWQRGKETATCHSRADVGSIRVDKWHLLRGSCE